MKINEIDYSAGASELVVSHDHIINNSVKVGNIENKNIYLFESGAQKMYFFQTNKMIDSYIILVNSCLKAIRNITKIAGAVTTLIGFVVHRLNQPITILANEPFTPEGFNWLNSLLNTPRGFTIKDKSGKFPNIAKLEKEWQQAMKSNVFGTTEIIIECHERFTIFESNQAGRLIYNYFWLTHSELF